MTKAQAEAAKKRCKAAAEGPWFVDEITDDGLTVVDDGKQSGRFATRESQFIAHARTDLSAALEMLERAVKLHDRIAPGVLNQLSPTLHAELLSLLGDWHTQDE